MYFYLRLSLKSFSRVALGRKSRSEGHSKQHSRLQLTRLWQQLETGSKTWSIFKQWTKCVLFFNTIHYTTSVLDSTLPWWVHSQTVTQSFFHVDIIDNFQIYCGHQIRLSQSDHIRVKTCNVWRFLRESWCSIKSRLFTITSVLFQM